FIVHQRRPSAQKRNTDAAFIMDHGKEFYQPDLAGTRHMGPAAGADIRARDLYDPDLAGKLLFAPVLQSGKLLLRRTSGGPLLVRPYQAIGPRLDVQPLLTLQKTVDIDRHLFRPRTKIHVIIAEPAVDQAGNQMLPRVLPHMQKTPAPVDFSQNRFS